MSGGRHGRAAITAGAAALLVAICGGAAASGATDGDQQGAAAERPNIVVIVTDDQDTGSFTRKLMPKTFGLMDGGTRLTNFTIATPLCCPSRAAQLTGQYGHNNGVLSNHPGYQKLRDPRNVLPAWLRRSGYETAHVGRYLNGYRRAARDGPRHRAGTTGSACSTSTTATTTSPSTASSGRCTATTRAATRPAICTAGRTDCCGT